MAAKVAPIAIAGIQSGPSTECPMTPDVKAELCVTNVFMVKRAYRLDGR